MAKFNLFSTLKNDLDVDTVERTISVIPPLNKKDYGKVRSILLRLGGEWSIQDQVFYFPKCPQALLDRVLAVGSRSLNKYHFYPTPAELFEYMTLHTPLSYFGASQPHVRVLEPECGEGGLIRMLLEFGEQEGRHFDIDGYDLDPLNVIFCKEAGFNVQEADFLAVEPRREYDLIVMNPPFNGVEFIKHIKHAQKFLGKNGLLISVVPTEWILESGSCQASRWLLEQAQIESTAELNDGNFFEPGTFKNVSIPTTIICLNSAEQAEKILNSERYRDAALYDFDLYFDNTGKYFETLNELKMKEADSQEFMEAITRLVTTMLEKYSCDTVHIVRRFKAEYIAALMKIWSPTPIDNIPEIQLATPDQINPTAITNIPKTPFVTPVQISLTPNANIAKLPSPKPVQINFFDLLDNEESGKTAFMS